MHVESTFTLRKALILPVGVGRQFIHNKRNGISEDYSFLRLPLAIVPFQCLHLFRRLYSIGAVFASAAEMQQCPFRRR